MSRISSNQSVILPLLLAIVLAGCRDDQMAQEGYDQARAEPIAEQPSDQDFVQVDTARTLERLLDLQATVYSKKDDLNAAQALLSFSFDSTTGCFLTVGKGTINPAHPASARKAGRKLAAGYEGKRWGLYLKVWYSGTWIPFGTPIEGEVVYSKVLHERIANDTLYQLMILPLGSIVVRDYQSNH